MPNPRHLDLGKAVVKPDADSIAALTPCPIALTPRLESGSGLDRTAETETVSSPVQLSALPPSPAGSASLSSLAFLFQPAKGSPLTEKEEFSFLCPYQTGHSAVKAVRRQQPTPEIR